MPLNAFLLLSEVTIMSFMQCIDFIYALIFIIISNCYITVKINNNKQR